VSSKATKKYDRPKTSYKRVLKSKYIDSAAKTRFRSQYKNLNSVEFKRAITKLQDRLTELAAPRNRTKKSRKFCL
jgi:hypothetical protein